MHVVNKSAEWSSTTNPVRHHASQSSAQGQPANQPEGARRSKSNNPTCSHHGSLCALSRIYQSWPLHCCSARFVCACVCMSTHILSSHHWPACSMPEIQTQSCKWRGEKRQNYALQRWPGMSPLQHQIMTENAELCAFFLMLRYIGDGCLMANWSLLDHHLHFHHN